MSPVDILGIPVEIEVTLTDAEGRPMSETITTSWQTITHKGITFTAIRDAIPRAVIGADGELLFWQEGRRVVCAGDTVTWGFQWT